MSGRADTTPLDDTNVLRVALVALGLLITQVLLSDTPAGPVWNIGVMHGAVVALFAASGLLSRHASVEGSK